MKILDAFMDLNGLFALPLLLVPVIIHCLLARDRVGRFATYTRWFLAIVMITAGGSKLWPEHVPSIIGPVWLEEKLRVHQLGLFARFVAFSELAIGLLLTSRRLAALGAVTLVPMLSCILMITISLQWSATPYVVASMLALNVFLLYYERRRLLPIICH